MNINHLDSKKTAVLFFDMLNVYYHGASEETNKKPKAGGRQRRAADECARAARNSDLLRMANHRADGESPQYDRSPKPTCGYGPGRLTTAIQRYTAPPKDRGNKR